jgi:hypothetical protein
VLKFQPGTTNGSDLGISVVQPYGITLDTSNNLLVTSNAPYPSVEVFAPGATQPSRTITGGLGNYSRAYGIALDKREKHLYIGDDSQTDVVRDSYVTGYLLNTIPGTASSYGIAVSPPAPK